MILKNQKKKANQTKTEAPTRSMVEQRPVPTEALVDRSNIPLGFKCHGFYSRKTIIGKPQI